MPVAPRLSLGSLLLSLVVLANPAPASELADLIATDYQRHLGALFTHFHQNPELSGMGAEDFGFFTTEPYIPGTYFAVGGTPMEDFARAAAGGAPIPSHHSPQFRVVPEPAITLGVEATVVALQSLLQASSP